MIVEKLEKDKITISFSRKIGTAGIKSIKNFIELLEMQAGAPKRKVSQSIINEVADEITLAGWKKYRKAKK
jgi:hypothetical protein